MAIKRSTKIERDPKSGLYIVDGTEPPTEMTLAQYEAGVKVLALREKAGKGE